MGSDDTPAEMFPDLGRYRGYFLRNVAVVTTASATSSVRITLTAASNAEVEVEVDLTLNDILHIQMDTAQSWDDFVDELTAVQLPAEGPWPQTAHHLLHHHDGRRALVWLRLQGPGPIHILARTLTITAH